MKRNDHDDDSHNCIAYSPKNIMFHEFNLQFRAKSSIVLLVYEIL